MIAKTATLTVATTAVCSALAAVMMENQGAAHSANMFSCRDGCMLSRGVSEEAAVGAALVIADGAQLGCLVGAVRGTTIARNKARPGRLVVGTMLGL
jgi:hypothetical protein